MPALKAFHRAYSAFVCWAHCARAERLDRGPMYLWIHASLVFVGIGLAIQPVVTGALTGMSRDLARGLAIIILAGSGVCLVGACMGKHFFREAAVDVRIPYMAAAFGQISVITSLATFSTLILANSPIIGILTGSLTLGIMGGCAQIAAIAIKETWRFHHLLGHPDCKWFGRACDRGHGC